MFEYWPKKLFWTGHNKAMHWNFLMSIKKSLWYISIVIMQGKLRTFYLTINNAVRVRWLVSFSYFIFIDQNFSNIKLSNVIRGNQLTFTSQYYWKSTWSPLRAWCRLGTAGMRGVAQLYSKFWIHSFQNFEFTLFIIDKVGFKQGLKR